MSAPSLPALLAHGWSLAPAADAAMVASAAAYGWSARRVPAWPWRRSACFAGGLATIAVALQSGLDLYDDRLLSVHMVQHLLLLVLAPLLLLEGRPLILLLRALPPARRHRPAGALRRLGGALRPLLCLVAYGAILLALHVPAVFQAAVRHAPVHAAEHALLLSAGLLMWWPVLDGDPLPSRRLGGLARLGYLVAAMVPMSAVGAWLAHDTGLAYSVYATPAHALGVVAVADQQAAGGVMWVAGNVAVALAALWLAMSALLEEERRQQALDRRGRDQARPPGARPAGAGA